MQFSSGWIFKPASREHQSSSHQKEIKLWFVLWIALIVFPVKTYSITQICLSKREEKRNFGVQHDSCESHTKPKWFHGVLDVRKWTEMHEISRENRILNMSCCACLRDFRISISSLVCVTMKASTSHFKSHPFFLIFFLASLQDSDLKLEPSALICFGLFSHTALRCQSLFNCLYFI